jgi:hypothetical protein
MPIPKRKKDEDRTDFLSRCMGDPVMNKDYKDNSQRYAICTSSLKQSSKAEEIQDSYYDQTFGSTDLIVDENDMYVPAESEYVDFGEETEEYIIGGKPGLWENIRKKKEREGKKYRPAKPGDPDRPQKDAFKKAQSGEDSQMQVSQIKKMCDQLMMLVKISNNIDIEFEEYAKDMISKSETYIQTVFDSVLYPQPEDEVEEPSVPDASVSSVTVWKLGDFSQNVPASKDAVDKLKNILASNTGDGIVILAAEKPGKKVTLNKPFRTPKGPKKFSVYVKNEKGNIVKVNFGDPNMSIKRDDPERRKSFRARHQCDTNPGPKWKARYWSCKFWSKTDVSDLT